MNKIKELDNKLVSLKTLEWVEKSEHVCGFESVRCSSQYIGSTWFDITLIDGTHIDVFCNIET